MQPGRELDALVAEKVMGLAITTTWKGKLATESEWKEIETVPGPYKHYSIDISAAWEVVEKMEKEGFDFCIHKYNGNSYYKAQFDKNGDLDTIIYREPTGESAPHAICLASLEAIGMEV